MGIIHHEDRILHKLYIYIGMASTSICASSSLKLGLQLKASEKKDSCAVQSCKLGIIFTCDPIVCVSFVVLIIFARAVAYP